MPQYIRLRENKIDRLNKNSFPFKTDFPSLPSLSFNTLNAGPDGVFSFIIPARVSVLAYL